MADSTYSSAETIAWLAANAHRVQAKIRERRAAPEMRKAELRLFPAPEAASYIPVSYARFRQLLADTRTELPQGERIGGNNRTGFSVDDLRQIRDWQYQITKEDQYFSKRRPGEKLAVIATANFKGGAAKTTTACHLAQYFAFRGYRTLAIDLDPQASMTGIMGYDPNIDLYDDMETQDFKSILGPLLGACPLKDVILKTHVSGLDFVGSNVNLQVAEYDLVAMADKPSSEFFLQLSKSIQGVEQDYDIVVVDCPPSLNLTTMNGICAANAVLIPAPAHMIDFASTGSFLHLLSVTLKDIMTTYGFDHHIDLLRILITRFSAASQDENRVANWMGQEFDEYLMTQRMVMTDSLKHSGNRIETLYETPDPRSRKTLYRGIDAMNAVNQEFETLLLRHVWGREIDSLAQTAA